MAIRAGRPPGACPGRSAATSKLGKIRRPTIGENSTPAQTPCTCCAGATTIPVHRTQFLLTVTSVVLVALGGLAGSITDYRSYFPALGGAERTAL